MTGRRLAWTTAALSAFALPFEYLSAGGDHALWPLPLLGTYTTVALLLRAIRLSARRG
ncbi:hypothetical protein [Streptacidiphilus sp. MAP5-3]|uniref:hypothetical protein n=1 Tax=unclassified Streptacidiphilus TaxID=2643834 RepID=UPI003512EF5E